MNCIRTGKSYYQFDPASTKLAPSAIPLCPKLPCTPTRYRLFTSEGCRGCRTPYIPRPSRTSATMGPESHPESSSNRDRHEHRRQRDTWATHLPCVRRRSRTWTTLAILFCKLTSHSAALTCSRGLCTQPMPPRSYEQQPTFQLPGT
jgi:hypothetical protein